MPFKSTPHPSWEERAEQHYKYAYNNIAVPAYVLGVKEYHEQILKVLKEAGLGIAVNIIKNMEAPVMEMEET